MSRAAGAYAFVMAALRRLSGSALRALVISAGAVGACCSSVACSASDDDGGNPLPDPVFPPGTGGFVAGGAAGAATGGVGFGGGGGAGGQVVPPGDPVLPDPTSLDGCGQPNEAGLGATQIDALRAGGNAAGMRWLLPYDGTIFPRGLLTPLLMWEGASGEAVYVHIKSNLFEYEGCLVPTAPGQVLLPQNVWDTMGNQAAGEADPYTIELSVWSGGTVFGPIAERIVIAQATLKGSVYYNSYSSEIFRSAGGFEGAVLRIRPGASAEVFLDARNCHGCHSVSADGSRLVANTSSGSGDGFTYGISAGAPPQQLVPTAPATAFTGLSHDGSVYISNSGTAANMPQGVHSGGVATLYETDTGTAIPGSGIPGGASMPTFATDSSLITFNDDAINGSRGLAVMDFDLASRAASGYRVVFETPDGYPGWPFFLPDKNAIVFALGSSATFSGEGGMIALPVLGAPLSPNGPPSDLFVVDPKTGVAVILARAMGFNTPQDAAANLSYLPFGREDIHQNYYPTVSPVAAGGYFWVFFDSIRHVGNLGRQRQLWGTAVRISADGTYSADPSAPAFYLTGQEFGTGNHRAFTALDACRENGSTCETGIDCCSGFCENGVCGVIERCANTDEACTTDDDCCDGRNRCLGGFCGVLIR